ncbi:aspartate/glutamate racemase family protein [uncultured Castellaniella sp.]|uniref:aspartate/glutamate racemase family protein n=1 Tax=uncultured Castellaniella sp. TaxID=647907 RepID=UPI002634F5A0|nr:aspartate/glutamate racemase family protein [uncultured Castellaniella sp.]
MQIRLINPNTTAGMTQKIGQVAAELASPGTEISVSNPDSGPVSIESHFDDVFGAVGVLEEIRNAELAGGADAYIIACFGDPGLLAAREMTRAPVLGIAEAAFHVASLISTRFSVVTTLGRTCVIAEHLLAQYGLGARCKRIRAAEIPVLDLEESPGRALEMIIDESIKAKREDGIGAIVLGCGGMADLTAQISEAVGLPVVEGVSAAVKLAEALVGLGAQTSKHGDLDFPIKKPFLGRFDYLSQGVA